MGTEENYLDNLLHRNKEIEQGETQQDLEDFSLEDLDLEEDMLLEAPVLESGSSDEDFSIADILGEEDMPILEKESEMENEHKIEEDIQLQEAEDLEKQPEMESESVIEEPKWNRLEQDFDNLEVLDEKKNEENESTDIPLLDEMAEMKGQEFALEDLENFPDLSLDEPEPILEESESPLDVPVLTQDELDIPSESELPLDVPEILIDEPDSLSESEELSMDDFDIPDEPELPLDIPEIAVESELERMNELESEENKLGTENEELNLEELDLDSLDLDDTKPDDLNSEDDNSDMDLDLDIDIDDMTLGGNADSDDDLDDVLSMLDTDSDLAEINDMLKKSDNNEPIQDDMMDLLNQMAENEEAFVDADEKNTAAEAEKAASVSETDDKKKAKKEKASKKKKGKGVDTAESEEIEGDKKQGFFGKLFNALTEELVPEPTEEELAAEKAAKAAKKQENQTKKEEEKAVKEQEKEAKATEKEAAQKAKAEAAAQKKKEKAAAKEAKLAAKRAKEAAEGPLKRIPPKKIAIAAVFGASICGAVIVATNVLSAQGYLQKARNAFDGQDYKTVYLSTYGMDLNGSDDLMQKKSEVILKMQRRYDSYQTNLKMGREIEALNSLIMVYTTYDTINADAEQYGAVQEVEAIKADIENILSTKYGLDEAAARELLLYEDNLEYTMALNNIIMGNE